MHSILHEQAFYDWDEFTQPSHTHILYTSLTALQDLDKGNFVLDKAGKVVQLYSLLVTELGLQSLWVWEILVSEHT